VTNVSQGDLLVFPDSKTELIQERLAHALTVLHELLEEYSPSWYTQKHHKIAEAALNDLMQQ